MTRYANTWFKSLKNELINRKNDKPTVSTQHEKMPLITQLGALFNALKSGVIFTLCLYGILFVAAGLLAFEGEGSFYEQCDRIFTTDMMVAIASLGAIAALISWLSHIWAMPNRRRK
ncbi:hypothetical protein F9817_08980 [Vibrio sp. CAIM 722]|uniref:Uncharacterized protein n=1 Tax=Vibrio eleionomae TaxID=2653505 RepID=A0A7X4LJZ3_9VIBR|nr:hypothetical protein [Vibrio eleionomae]MZI93329.1 hypothetical protein [Vibrio eleionomae]